MGRPEIGRKSTAEENGKRRKEELLVEGGEEDVTGRGQHFPTGVFNPARSAAGGSSALEPGHRTAHRRIESMFKV